eukprot:CAMPEP_0202436884 /NCGR_PEP_ID=MMETSP1345-20130828/26543_1 /ASSEMBLY_ACC=CAM_ASM_000843 /TAXON_ID=342563 /ORGANISM="Fabrea Fabrea salina" /LENGTH=31 /DNA_ID= /DNA_START= /DNA_END= /DNA_ORIENTATION=
MYKESNTGARGASSSVKIDLTPGMLPSMQPM